jgi:hypothetical protein
MIEESCTEGKAYLQSKILVSSNSQDQSQTLSSLKLHLAVFKRVEGSQGESCELLLIPKLFPFSTPSGACGTNRIYSDLHLWVSPST